MSYIHNIKKKKQLVSILLPMSLLASSVTYADEGDARIAALEQEVALLKSEQNSENWTDKISMNGFASVGFGKANNDAGYLGYDEDNTFKQDSVFAVQTSFAFTDNTEATVQLIARGDEDWDPEFEWAFLAHKLADNLTVRGGKLRLPVYMLSDYLDVGYAYAFARPNGEIYDSGLSAYTGMDMLYSVNISDAIWTIQPFAGEADFAPGTELKDMWGLVNLLEWEELTFRVSYLETEVDFGVPGFELDASFVGLGFTYDNDALLVMIESTTTEVESQSKDTTADFIALAYRFNEFQPYLTLSRRESATSERSGYSLGLRWDFTESLAVKFDVSTAHDFDGTSGGLAGNTGVAPAFDEARVSSIIFDAIF